MKGRPELQVTLQSVPCSLILWQPFEYSPDSQFFTEMLVQSKPGFEGVDGLQP